MSNYNKKLYTNFFSIGAILVLIFSSFAILNSFAAVNQPAKKCNSATFSLKVSGKKEEGSTLTLSASLSPTTCGEGSVTYSGATGISGTNWKPTKAGTYTIVATQKRKGGGTPYKDSKQIIIAAKGLTLTGPKVICPSTPEDVSATKGTKPYTYSSSDDAIAKVDKDTGKVTGQAKPGKVTITVTDKNGKKDTHDIIVVEKTKEPKDVAKFTSEAKEHHKDAKALIDADHWGATTGIDDSLKVAFTAYFDCKAKKWKIKFSTVTMDWAYSYGFLGISPENVTLGGKESYDRFSAVKLEALVKPSMVRAAKGVKAPKGIFYYNLDAVKEHELVHVDRFQKGFNSAYATAKKALEALTLDEDGTYLTVAKVEKEFEKLQSVIDIYKALSDDFDKVITNEENHANPDGYIKAQQKTIKPIIDAIDKKIDDEGGNNE